MVFLTNGNGEIISVFKRRIFQGSNNAAEIVFGGPFSNANSVTATFSLPDGSVKNETLLSFKSVPDTSEIFSSDYAFFSVPLSFSVTKTKGEVGVQFKVYSLNEVFTTETATFTVEEGIIGDSSIDETEQDFGGVIRELTALREYFDDVTERASLLESFTVNGKTGTVVLDADDISDTTTTNKFVTASEKSTWNAKQNALTFDNAPTENSDNPVKSGGIYTALVRKQNALTFDSTPTAGSDNPVTSAGIKSAIDTAVSSVYKYKGSVATYSDLPSTGLTAGDVYNVEDTGDNYAWTGSAWDKLAGTVDLSGYVPTSRTINSKALTGNITLTQDDVGDGTTYKQFSATEKTKLSGIEAGAQKIQYSTMPTASADFVNRLVQYVGTTGNGFEFGKWYRSVGFGGDYTWQEGGLPITQIKAASIIDTINFNDYTTSGLYIFTGQSFSNAPTFLASLSTTETFWVEIESYQGPSGNPVITQTVDIGNKFAYRQYAILEYDGWTSWEEKDYSNIPTTSQITAWNGKQNALTFDSAPTENSTNPVQSGGVYTALSGKQATIDSSHKLSADLVDDTSTTNKFVTSAEKTAWDNKADKPEITTDLSSTSKTLTLAKNTRYVLGELTALSITFPTANLIDGDKIVIGFVSGSTATTLTRDTVNAVYNFDSVGAGKFVEFNAEYKASISKWVVLSAEVDYTVPVGE